MDDVSFGELQGMEFHSFILRCAVVFLFCQTVQNSKELRLQTDSFFLASKTSFKSILSMKLDIRKLADFVEFRLTK